MASGGYARMCTHTHACWLKAPTRCWDHFHILSQLNHDGSFIRRITSPISQEWKQTQDWIDLPWISQLVSGRSGINFHSVAQTPAFSTTSPCGAQRSLQGKGRQAGQGQGLQEGRKGGGSGRGSKGAERERVVVRAGGILSSDLIKIYFLKTG